MFDVFSATLSPMLVMFLCIVVGFILNKKKLCPENTTTVLSKLETYVLCPALNLITFSQHCTPESLSENYDLLIYAVIVTTLAISLSYLLAPLFAKKGYIRNVYKYALAFANCGFMGNAIVPAILGTDALYPYMLFTLPPVFAIYTWGLFILIPKGEKSNPLKNLLNPPMIAVAIGMFLGLSGLNAHLPAFIADTMSSLSACMGPIAMVLTGFVIGNYSLKAMISDKKIYIASALRLLILPAIFIGIFILLGASSTVVTMCFFAFATPLGLNTVVFPAAYGGDTATGAAMATISHVICVITMPVMYALLTLFI